MFRQWPFNRLMESGDPGGGGADPPKDPPSGGDPPGDPPEPQTIALDVIPEELRNRPAAEVKFLLDHMASSIGERNNLVEDLRSQLAEAKATPPAPEDVKEPDPNENIPMEELILSDPDAAIERYLEKKGYVSAVGQLSAQVGETTFAMVAQTIPDFKEYEEGIREILKNGNLPMTEVNITGAYKLALADKVIADRGRDLRAAGGAEPPSLPTPPEPPKDSGTLSDLEKEIMVAHGVTDEAEWASLRDTPPEIKVPV